MCVRALVVRGLFLDEAEPCRRGAEVALPNLGLARSLVAGPGELFGQIVS
jgi:hypothetical protein